MAETTGTQRSTNARKASTRRSTGATKRSTTAKKAAQTRAAKSGSTARRRTTTAAKSRARTAQRTTARETRQAELTLQNVAERAVLIPVGAALEAGDRVANTVRTYSDTRLARQELNRFERRGAKALGRTRRTAERQA